jgi:dipeptidyl aminopeptidase/acylaminoacyl peptidase
MKTRISILWGWLVLLALLMQGGFSVAAFKQESGGAPVRIYHPNPAIAAPAEDSTTSRVSVATDGTQANSSSYSDGMSGDGRYVVFESAASNLVSDDTDVTNDCFVHDRQTGETRRVSVASDGSQGNENSAFCAISQNGRFVVFASDADNLVGDDTNDETDIFLHDLQTGQTSLVSLATDGSQANRSSEAPSISADGRYVTFFSDAANLVANDTNDCDDVFLRDRQTEQTTRVSVASDGSQANDCSSYHSISADGRYIAFQSWADNLTSGDDNETSDIFVYDRQTGQTVCASKPFLKTGNGGSWTPAISGDGRFVAFNSEATDLVVGDTNNSQDIFLYNMQTAEISRVSVDSQGHGGDSESGGAHLSADGQYIVFDSSANNLDPTCADSPTKIRDIFLHDQVTGSTTCISKSTHGVKGDESSAAPFIADDGRSISFFSSATNLVEGDTNNFRDVFVWALNAGYLGLYLPVIVR